MRRRHTFKKSVKPAKHRLFDQVDGSLDINEQLFQKYHECIYKGMRYIVDCFEKQRLFEEKKLFVHKVFFDVKSFEAQLVVSCSDVLKLEQFKTMLINKIFDKQEQSIKCNKTFVSYNGVTSHCFTLNKGCIEYLIQVSGDKLVNPTTGHYDDLDAPVPMDAVSITSSGNRSTARTHDVSEPSSSKRLTRSGIRDLNLDTVSLSSSSSSLFHPYPTHNATAIQRTHNSHFSPTGALFGFSVGLSSMVAGIAAFFLINPIVGAGVLAGGCLLLAVTSLYVIIKAKNHSPDQIFIKNEVGQFPPSELSESPRSSLTPSPNSSARSISPQ